MRRVKRLLSFALTSLFLLDTSSLLVSSSRLAPSSLLSPHPRYNVFPPSYSSFSSPNQEDDAFFLFSLRSDQPLLLDVPLRARKEMKRTHS
jgi:hypothetical protein